MGGRTMPTECPHGVVFSHPSGCWQCRLGERESRDVRESVSDNPAEAVAQLVADGVLVERECENCEGHGDIPVGHGSRPCTSCKGSGKDGTYRLVLPDGEEETTDE